MKPLLPFSSVSHLPPILRHRSPPSNVDLVPPQNSSSLSVHRSKALYVELYEGPVFKIPNLQLGHKTLFDFAEVALLFSTFYAVLLDPLHFRYR